MLFRSQDRKRYTDKATAVKYLDGRKKAYSHLFAEISPPVPKEHENCFTVNGVLLPGYRIEGREQEKASVLEKLSAVKVQKKAGKEPKAANKKKEDIQI